MRSGPVVVLIVIPIVCKDLEIIFLYFAVVSYQVAHAQFETKFFEGTHSEKYRGAYFEYVQPERKQSGNGNSEFPDGFGKVLPTNCPSPQQNNHRKTSFHSEQHVVFAM